MTEDTGQVLTRRPFQPDEDSDENILEQGQDERFEYPRTDEKKTDDSSSVETSFVILFLKSALCVILGMIFGFAMEKGRVFEPRTIRYQMVFKKLIMLKMFLAAVSAGMFGLSLLAMISRFHRRFYNSCNDYYNKIADKGVLSSVVGGLLIGVGMTISGSCPTSIYTQLGAMVPNSGYAFLGALAASLFYGITKPKLDRLFKPSITESTNPWTSSPYFIMALPVAAMFGVVVCSFEILVPWTKDVVLKKPDLPYHQLKAWPPYISGAMIGFLQVPLLLGLGQTLGGSSSYLTVVSQVFVGPLRRVSPFIAKYRCGFKSWWQVFYVCGVMLGAYISAYCSGYLGWAKGVSAGEAFVGGFMILLGARIAGGCTSGHGLSGMSLLSILSVITVACMFGGAICTGYLMKYMNILKLS